MPGGRVKPVVLPRPQDVQKKKQFQDEQKARLEETRQRTITAQHMLRVEALQRKEIIEKHRLERKRELYELKVAEEQKKPSMYNEQFDKYTDPMRQDNSSDLPVVENVTAHNESPSEVAAHDNSPNNEHAIVENVTVREGNIQTVVATNDESLGNDQAVIMPWNDESHVNDQTVIAMNDKTDNARLDENVTAHSGESPGVAQTVLHDVVIGDDLEKVVDADVEIDLIRARINSILNEDVIDLPQ